MTVAIRQRLRNRRKQQIKRRIQRNKGKLRLSVFKSVNHIYAQIIDDTEGRTVASASSREKVVRESVSSGGSSEAAKAVGKQLAERAMAANITAVVFDRGGRLFHGRVKALADASREGGLNF